MKYTFLLGAFLEKVCVVNLILRCTHVQKVIQEKPVISSASHLFKKLL